MQHFLAALDARLADRPWVAGDRFSVADITAAVAVDFAPIVKVRPDALHHPHVVRWREALAQRSSMAL